MCLKTVPIKVTTAGAAGSAAGTGQSSAVVQGEVLGAYIAYDASAPATTDVTLRTVGNGPPSYDLLAVADGNTDGFFAPRAKPVDNTNTAITNAHAPFPVADYLEAAVAGCDALTDAVVVHVLVRE